MSDTKKDKLRRKFEREQREYHAKRKKFIRKMEKKGLDVNEAWFKFTKNNIDPWDKLSGHQHKTIINYSKSPSWFNRMFSNKPKKREDKVLLRKIMKGEIDDAVFTHPKRPHFYYW